MVGSQLTKLGPHMTHQASQPPTTGLLCCVQFVCMCLYICFASSTPRTSSLGLAIQDRVVCRAMQQCAHCPTISWPPHCVPLSLHFCPPSPPPGQFTSLHTLSIDCAAKACVDFEALRLMPHLQRLHLAQFSFADEVFAVGLAHCVTLEALHLENQQVRVP